MPPPPFLDDLGEQLLTELLPAPLTSAPRLLVMEDGFCVLGSHVGGRRNRNEDRVAVARVDVGTKVSYSLFVVCDGVGGSQRGDEAAAIACATLISALSTQTDYRSPADLLPDLVRAADDVVRQRLAGSGLTTVCAYLNSSRGSSALVSIGDSRAYSWDQGSDLIQLTEDDTLGNEIRQLSPHARTFLNERGLESSLSQAIGEHGRSSNDLNVKVITERGLPPGGLLLATDGAWVNDEGAFHKTAKNSRSTHELVRRLLTCAHWLGGIDNASAIVIREPQQLPETVEQSSRHTRTTMWLADKQVVAYRAQPVAAAPVTPSSPPAVKQAKKRSKKKTGTKPAQLELPDAEPSPKGKTIVAGPDE